MRNKILYLVLLVFSISAILNGQENLTPEQLKIDFNLARQALQEAHPGLYRYNSKTSMDSLFKATELLIDHNMSQQEFYRLLVPVIGRIGCGHTKLHPDSNWENNYFYGRDHLFPLRLHISGSRAFVLGSYEKEIIPAGSEIVKINDQPIGEIIGKLILSSFSDGRNVTFRYIELDRFFSAYYANMLEAPETFSIQYNDGQPRQAKIPAVTFEIIDQYYKQQESNNEKRPYFVSYPDEHTALMTISSFWMKGDKSFSSFLKSSFSDFRERKINNLIIDLRNNEGGEDARGAGLLACLMDRNFRYYDRLQATTDKKYSFSEQARLPKFYGILRSLLSKTDSGTYVWKHSHNLKLQKPAKNHYDGKVYVLINGASFSVTSEFAAAAHYNKRATFIGEETGGGYYGNNSGTFVIVTLPNSRLNIGIPMLAYYMAVKDYPYKDRGVIPDYTVEPTVQDLLNGTDPVMKFALDLIDKIHETKPGR
jgi:C-terminal processing protease CtpA/Prc